MKKIIMSLFFVVGCSAMQLFASSNPTMSRVYGDNPFGAPQRNDYQMTWQSYASLASDRATQADFPDVLRDLHKSYIDKALSLMNDEDKKTNAAQVARLLTLKSQIEEIQARELEARSAQNEQEALILNSVRSTGDIPNMNSNNPFGYQS